MIHRRAYSYVSKTGKRVRVKSTTYRAKSTRSRRHEGPRKRRSDYGVSRPHRRGVTHRHRKSTHRAHRMGPEFYSRYPHYDVGRIHSGRHMVRNYSLFA
jgi:hypothetical protein